MMTSPQLRFCWFLGAVSRLHGRRRWVEAVGVRCSDAEARAVGKLLARQMGRRADPAGGPRRDGPVALRLAGGAHGVRPAARRARRYVHGRGGIDRVAARRRGCGDDKLRVYGTMAPPSRPRAAARRAASRAARTAAWHDRARPLRAGVVHEGAGRIKEVGRSRWSPGTPSTRAPSRSLECHEHRVRGRRVRGHAAGDPGRCLSGRRPLLVLDAEGGYTVEDACSGGVSAPRPLPHRRRAWCSTTTRSPGLHVGSSALRRPARGALRAADRARRAGRGDHAAGGDL